MFYSLPVFALPQESRVPGGIALVDLGDAKGSAPQVFIGDAPGLVMRVGGGWRAVVGIPLDLSSGTLNVHVRTADGLTRIETITVANKAYPSQQLKLNPAMVTPPPELSARIETERLHLAQVRSTWSLRSPPEIALSLPAEGPLSARYGARRILNGQQRSAHAGLDVAVPTGTPITAPGEGRVIDAGDYYYCGKAVFIDHGQGLITMHCHLSAISAAVGDTVTRGQRIGLSGATGRVTGPHLHWSIYLNGTSVDPELFLKMPPIKPKKSEVRSRKANT